jgi:ketopantoate reductase
MYLQINGYLLKQDEKLGIKNPVNQFIYSCLFPKEQIERGLK